MTLIADNNEPVLIVAVQESVHIIATEKPSFIVGSGIQGIQGISGNAGYLHVQSTPATTWIINHNLGHYPSIELMTVGGVRFDASITHTSPNQAIVYLAVEYVGIAQCN